MLRDERNNELMAYLRYKLVRSNDKVDKIVNWFEDKDDNSKVGESVTLGTKENLKVLGVSAIVPGGAAAVGLGSLLAGILVVLPLIGGPPLNEAEAQAYEQLTSIGENVMNFSMDAFNFAIKTSLIPLGVSAISLPKRLFRFIGEIYEEKTEPSYVENEKVIELINDIISKKDDTSLTFAKTLLKRVSLKENSDKFNMELLKNLAYHRFCIQSLETHRRTEKDVAEAFTGIINQLQDAKKSFGVSSEFKNNRFINLLLEDENFREENYSSSMKK